ncbi:hypothetical protein BH11BAC2_BH11BAC2_06210 [soil metagenome]
MQKNYDYIFQFSAVHRWVETCVQLHPDAPAVWCDHQIITYKELNERANRLAHTLSKDSRVNGGRVGICLDRSHDLMIALLAVLKAGAAYVPFDVEYPAERLQYMAEVSEIPVMITSKEQSHRIPQGNFTLLLVDELPIFTEENNLNLTLEVNHTQPAYVLFTSGSTGKPKGVVMPHKALLNLLNWQVENTSVHQGGKTLQFAPISFDVHFQEIFSTWVDGGCIYLINDELRLNALHLLNYLQEQKVNRLFLPFIALQNLSEIAENTNTVLPDLKEVITAGEQLQVTPALIKFFSRIPHCTLFNHYGPTEAHVVSSFQLEGLPDTWPLLPPIGKEISNVELYILNDSLQPVENGQEGELFIAGDCLADGYLQREDLTAERFISNPFHTGKQMYRTGDLAKRLPDGNIIYLGRIDGQVKVRGYRIELGEIEIVLGRFPGAAQVAVTVREDKPGQKKLVAYFVSNENQTLPVKDLRSFLQHQLPDYMMPSAFVKMDQLPRTPSGKIDRKSLPPPDTSRPDLGIPYAAPENKTQELLAEVWSQLINIESIGIHDNFFDLGGNSLLALQSIAKLKQEANIDLSVVKMYQHPTISALAKVLDGKEEKSSLSVMMQERAAQRNKGNTEDNDIAIVGMSLRIPGAETPEQFWENLKNGVESISVFKDADLDPSIPAEVKNDPNYVKVRGVLADTSGFDAAFFNMNPNIAKVTDPQHRVFLELAWNALENSGYSPSRYPGLIGVFAGTGNNTYYLQNVLSNPDVVNRVGNFLTMTQNEKDYIATRVAYELNLKGLAVSVHTGCSTSLTAVVQACESLRNHQCDMALAGGVAITSPVNSGHIYEEGAMFSNDGSTRTFDAAARGTVFSDGAGIVVLKRYKDALADGDTIYALIKGAALNNDGGEKGSFTAPSVSGQAAVISMALAMAGVDARTISYVETHGTATPVGDPIEIEGLSTAFREHTPDKQFCAVGSVKTNIGHLTAAAGVAGLIKTALSLFHKQIPATLHYQSPNPQIPFTESPFFVNNVFRNWDTDQLPRRAGVSSFGVGGTNAHVVLEEAPTPIPSGTSRSRQLLLLSARTENALQRRLSDLKTFIAANKKSVLPDLAFTLQNGRHDFAFRWFATVESVDDAIHQFTQADPKKSAKHHLKQNATGVVFMFPGQGSQYVGMGSNLYRDELVFRQAVDHCCEILQPLLGRDLREILFAEEGNSDADTLLKQTYYTQPALFTIGYSLAQLWMSWGIKPAALIGHSIGEFVAATIANVFSLHDALTLVANRGRLMQEMPSGSMLSVRLSAEVVEKIIPPAVSIAAINGPQLCVVAGPDEEIQKLQQHWEETEVICKPLFTSHAFHSPMMDPLVIPFEELVKKVSLSAPEIPVLSTVTSDWLKAEEATNPHYWAHHLRATVRFADGVKALWKYHPNVIMLELGPRNTASSLARQQSIDPKVQKAIASLGDSAVNDAEWTNISSAIGQLWLSGISVNWKNFYALEKRKRIALPGYPFEHQQFWLQPGTPSPTVAHQQESPTKETQILTTPIPLPITMSNRKERIINEVREILEESSGIEMTNAEPTSSFVELGLDSLFLTQIALTLSKKYGVKITFRQLNENLSSLESLASHLDQQLPADAVAPISIPVNHSPSPTQQINNSPALNTPSMQQPAPEGTMQWVLAQQFQLMQQQLIMLQGNMGNAASQQILSSLSQPLPVQNTPSSPQHEEVTHDELKELKKPFGAVARIEKTINNTFNDNQKQWLENFTKAYTEKTKKSKAYTQEYRGCLADPRVVTGFRPLLKEIIYQPVVNKSVGAFIWDIDGNKYVDVLNGFGSNMFGHNPPFIVKALQEQLNNGYELGPQHELAGEVAQLICELTNSDRAGFCNTGSEAVLGAMRIARTVTGRSLIVSFNGSYHGINDEVILRGSKKLKSIPAAAGILPGAVQNMLVLDYGTPEALAIIKSRGHEIAAVLVEPVQSRRADFHPREFLHELRKLTEADGSLLIFDEVITGFRVLPGGAQEYFGVKADLGTYGKVVGGGMPIGVIAGKKEYMDALDGGHWQFGDESVPEIGVTYFAGTFVRHPFALAAAKASLLHMKEKGVALQNALTQSTTTLTKSINEYCHQQGIPFHLVNFGSLFKPKYDLDLPNADLLYPLLRFSGVHIYDGFPCFLTEAHTKEDVDFIIATFKTCLGELVEYGFIPTTKVDSEFEHVKRSTYGHHSNGNGNGNGNGTSVNHPPVTGAIIGKNPDGTPGWFVPDPERPGKYLKVVLN